MKTQLKITAAALSLLAATAITTQAQTITDPCPNRVISWNFDNNGTINPTDLAGLAPAVNWVNSWPANQTLALPDNTGAATTLDLNYGSFGGWSVGGHPGLDANGTANRELVNGYLNSGPAAWGPWTTNTWVSLTNVPYALYDVIVYFNADASGRKSSIEGPNATYHFSTMGSASRSGANALFVPTTETNTTVFPTADFAVWRGLTGANPRFTTYPKSGNDQWLGICGFQVIESSNAYCLYGPAPAAQIVPLGQPAAFSVIAGGQDIKYQWRHAGVPIINATNATYSITATVSGQDGAYDVVITNSFSSITSAVATLTFYSPKSLEWAGNNSIWDLATAAWTTNGGVNSTLYTETDSVRFGPLGSAQPFVTLDSAHTPSSITVSNGSYTFAGGSLAGSGALHVKNNGTLILDLPDNRSGPTLIDAGSTLQLDNNDTAGSLGSGALTNNGALLFAAAGDEAYGYPIYGTGSITNNGSLGLITLGSEVRGNYLVQAGAGSLLLQGSNTLSGGLIVSGGQVWARAQDCLGQGPTVVSGGELQLIFGINFTGTSMSLAGGTLRGGIGGSPSYAGLVSLAADSQINVDGGSSLTFSNATGISGAAFNLTKGGGGTLVLPGANNTWASFTVSAGTVTINGTSGTGLVSVQAGGSLSGAGTLGGAVDIQADATLAPGASIGTMNIGGNLTLAGNLAIEVNRSVSPSNDLVNVTGTIVNSGAGVINVANLGPALQAGDKFKLFNKAVSGGATMTIAGGGTAVWSNKLEVDGSIEVVSVPLPRIVTSGITGSDFILSGTNGVAGGAYEVLSSTNVALPLAGWTSVNSGNFDGSGNFSVTIPVNVNEPQRYYLLRLP
jgi:autotransporter-associated beta strand protein